ncbi:hypothetical protein UA45_10120 [Morganella morganii]|uniref:ABC transporter domain-containing protein n=1 Tax=Morganella morganii TaxID=582 RepID=A0A0D8LAR1_MORMO|nr:hypothetical protein UA45_10120 [Morganella morganii]
MSALLELRNIYRRYPSGDSSVTVLDDVSLTIRAGEMVAIIGQSGSGKSTLMNILAAWTRRATGTILLPGKHSRAER